MKAYQLRRSAAISALRVCLLAVCLALSVQAGPGLCAGPHIAGPGKRSASPQEEQAKPGVYYFKLDPRISKPQIVEFIRVNSKKFRLDPYLIQAVMEAESGYEVLAVSPKGAQGLMQIMPGTGRDLNLAEPFDPAQNIEAGSRYLRQMLDIFGDTNLALAAYNAGPGAVKQYGGIPPFPETQRYVSDVVSRFLRLKTGKNLRQFINEALERSPGATP